MSTRQGATIREAMSSGASQEAARNVVFAAPADDPRTRRPADVVTLVLSFLVLLLAGWAYAEKADIDQKVLGFFADDLPGWLSAIFSIVFIAGAVYAAGLLIAILFFGHGRAAVARDMVVGALLVLGLTALMAWITGPEWLDILPELLERDGFPSYPVFRLALVVGMLDVARPYLSAPMRSIGRRLIWGMVFAGVILSYSTVTAIIGAVATGYACAAIVHLLFGSGVGIPSKARVREALDSIAVGVTDLDYLDHQPVGVAYLGATLDDGNDAIVKVYGRDATDAAAASRVWRSMFYRDFDNSLTATGLQQVEHEALMLLHGRAEGVPLAELVAWGRGPTGDALLVTMSYGGTALVDVGEIDDEVLDGCWEAVARLRDANMAHGSIDARRVVVTTDGVVLRDCSSASISPGASALAADVVQMLVTTAVLVGLERAIGAARRSMGDEALESALPWLQGNTLSSSLARDAKNAGIKVKDLREAVSDATGSEPPPLVQVERVTWGNVVMLALTLFAAYALISALADIGFDTIVEEVADAEWSWVVLAFVLAQLTNVGEYFSLTGVVHKTVPFGPTIMFRYALSFISLAVPSDAGAIAMNIRYMQKLGESTAAAVAQGPLLTVFSKGFDIILLVIAGRIIGQTVDLDDIDTGPALRLLLLVVAAIFIGLIVLFAVPKLRNRVLPHIRDAFHSIRASLTDPQRLLRVAGGTLMQKVLFAMTLSAAVSAYGHSLSFSEALFVNTAISLFVGLVPVPGGVGVAEAALTAGLTAVGVPEETAVAAALTHRIVTAYLPPVFGWWASRWLAERDYL